MSLKSNHESLCEREAGGSEVDTDRKRPHAGFEGGGRGCQLRDAGSLQKLEKASKRFFPLELLEVT